LGGPSSVPLGRFLIKVVLDRQNSPVGFGVIALQEGKTLADLVALGADNVNPMFTIMLNMFGLTNTGDTYLMDLPNNAAWHAGDPIFIRCVEFDSTGAFQTISNLGSITISAG
jgi:hypothetical protein